MFTEHSAANTCAGKASSAPVERSPLQLFERDTAAIASAATVRSGEAAIVCGDCC